MSDATTAFESKYLECQIKRKLCIYTEVVLHDRQEALAKVYDLRLPNL